MLCLSKKTEYALAALSHLAERTHKASSAREISDAYGLPPALLVKILKCLQTHGILLSTRGIRGGYRIVADLDETSLFDLVAIMECPDRPGEECGCLDHSVEPTLRLRSSRPQSAHGPAAALQYKFFRFLKDVKLSDLVLPGRRIEVPAERLFAAKAPASQRRFAHAHSAH